MLKELKKESVHEFESKKQQHFEEMHLLDRSIENRKNAENFVFYDGPATANGNPGIHHMLAKLLKDTFCKYKTMKGYRVLRKVGWDTHGLPVEVQVEKELGFNGKDDIEKYGIKEFNEKCRESVWKNEEAFRKFTNEMGQLIDLEHPYITYDNDYIETEWWILKKYFEAGLIYNGLKIVPYCPRCGTGLASHEVAQGYKDVSVNTVTVPFRLKKDENTYLLVWTTTPWTLLANVAACVNPNEEYVKCESKGYHFIVAKKLKEKVLGEEAKIEETYLGRDLEYLEYEQLLPFIKVEKKAFYITCADYVTMEDGTGIVHIASAFGQDDYEVGLKYDLPLVNPVDEKGCYTEGPWQGRFVLDPELEVEIIKYLASNDKLFKKQKLVHAYPHCWRCKTPLIYYSKPSLYIKTTAYKDQIIEENKKVHWVPEYVGEKRFGNWLEDMKDWAISRNRYWGTPIPLWKCECGHEEMIGSRQELKKKAIEEVSDDLDLHRPFVDDIHLSCPKCGKAMQRIPEVMDCWFDSGSMPFAQYHYPFENQELFESQFPADFICEGVDQTRGWFYSLICISTFVTGKAPYKNVLVNDLLLDKYGQKMHKSKGNAVEPFTILHQYGADATRFYMLYTSPVWVPLKFDEEGIKEVQSKFFNTLKNTYTFLQMYANTDKIDPSSYHVPYEKLEQIDRWLLSRYHHLIKDVTEAMDSYDLNKPVRLINYFMNEDFSNWYIRRCRRRFWESGESISKQAVYQTTYEVLKGICQLIAPMVPYISDEIYVDLTGEESVHLSDYPTYDEAYFDSELESRMELVRTFITLGRNAREEAKIKVRQPLSEILLDGKDKRKIEEFLPLIEEELNVKKVTFVDSLGEYMNIEMKPNFKLCGKIFGPLIKEFQEALKNLPMEAQENLQKGKNIIINVAGKEETITPEMVEIRLSAKEGFNASYENNHFVVLNTQMDEALQQEGLVRELISKVQNLRKSKDFDIADRITLYYAGDDKLETAIMAFQDMIKEETLSVEIVEKKDLKEESICTLNGMTCKLDVEVIKKK